MDDTRAELVAAMERFALASDYKLTTLGRQIGQDGTFYDRLRDEDRWFFPNTINAARQRLRDLEDKGRHNRRRVNPPTSVQPPAENLTPAPASEGTV